jgi:hypothetical protein
MGGGYLISFSNAQKKGYYYWKQMVWDVGYFSSFYSTDSGWDVDFNWKKARMSDTQLASGKLYAVDSPGDQLLYIEETFRLRLYYMCDEKYVDKNPVTNRQPIYEIFMTVKTDDTLRTNMQISGMSLP